MWRAKRRNKREANKLTFNHISFLTTKLLKIMCVLKPVPHSFIFYTNCHVREVYTKFSIYTWLTKQQNDNKVDDILEGIKVVTCCYCSVLTKIYFFIFIWKVTLSHTNTHILQMTILPRKMPLKKYFFRSYLHSI